MIEAFLDVVEIQDCDPYCVVQLEASQDEKQTPHFIKTKTPKWDCNLEFDAVKTAKQEIEFTVYDRDTFSDDYIGDVSFSLEDIKNDEKAEKWLKLIDKN